MVTSLDRELLEILKSNPGTKFSRSYLSQRLDAPDRAIRDAVRKLRVECERICSSSYDKGYWYGTEEDYMDTLREIAKRAASTAEPVTAWKNRELQGQIEISN